MDPHPEDALKFLVGTLAHDPEIYRDGNRPPYYDVFIPNAVIAFLRANSVQDRGDPEFCHREEFSGIWLAFYDAAWELCRRGIFRLSMRRMEGRYGVFGSLGDGYSLTSHGRKWLNESNTRYFPADSTKYAEAMAKPARLLAPAFSAKGDRGRQVPPVWKLSCLLCNVRSGCRIGPSCNRNRENEQ